MNRTFEDALVAGWEDLEETITLPDPDDRHVVAAAMRGRADAIVTANLRGFPDDVMTPLGIAVVSPDEFLLDQLDLAPRIVLDVLREHKIASEGLRYTNFHSTSLCSTCSENRQPTPADPRSRRPTCSPGSPGQACLRSPMKPTA